MCSTAIELKVNIGILHIKFNITFLLISENISTCVNINYIRCLRKKSKPFGGGKLYDRQLYVK